MRTTWRLSREAGRARPPAGDPSRRLIAGVGIWLGLVVLMITLIRVFRPQGPWPLIPAFAIAAAFVIFCLFDLARAEHVRYPPRWGWAIACLISVPLGGILYLGVGRVRLLPRPPSGRAPTA